MKNHLVCDYIMLHVEVKKIAYKSVFMFFAIEVKWGSKKEVVSKMTFVVLTGKYYLGVCVVQMLGVFG